MTKTLDEWCSFVVNLRKDLEYHTMRAECLRAEIMVVNGMITRLCVDDAASGLPDPPGGK